MRANNDPALLAACAADSVLPRDAGQLVGCAASSQGALLSLVSCAAAPKTNEDWQISAKCALDSGGDATGFTGCTAGRLAIAELSKCFKGKFGKDCFDPRKRNCQNARRVSMKRAGD
jgi:hypothetical protein